MKMNWKSMDTLFKVLKLDDVVLAEFLLESYEKTYVYQPIISTTIEDFALWFVPYDIEHMCINRHIKMIDLMFKHSKTLMTPFTIIIEQHGRPHTYEIYKTKDETLKTVLSFIPEYKIPL